ncbi:MAG: hypothetical protein HY709_05570, partial [Candidatus Latescibacteria bacterium]|nr:hypothetical protein [Candidatus Latescibacterota bacterium]
NWRFALTVAAIPTILSLIGKINGLATFYASYDTTKSLVNFLTGAILTDIVLGLVGIFIFSTGLIALVESLYRTAFPERPSIEEWVRGIRQGGPETGVTLRDALLLSCVACLINPAMQRLGDLGGHLFNLETGRVATFAPFVTTFLPGFEGLTDGLGDAIMHSAIIGLLAVVALLYIKRPLMIGALLALFIILSTGAETKTWTTFFSGVAGSAFAAAVVWIGIVTFYRHNLAAYALTAFLLAVTQAGWALTAQDDTFYRVNGIVLLIIAALPIVWYLFYGKRGNYGVT